MQQTFHQWRTARNYTKQQAADTFGLSVRQYERIERGDCPVPPYVSIIMGLLDVINTKTEVAA